MCVPEDVPEVVKAPLATPTIVMVSGSTEDAVILSGCIAYSLLQEIVVARVV